MKKLFDSIFGPCEPQDRIFRNIIVTTILLTAGICVLLGLFLEKGKSGGIMTFLVISAACFAGGGAVGFLFGLPKKGTIAKIQAKDKPDDEPNEYEDNTNLQEVSDWLTKLIVGLTLIKLNTILSWLANASASIKQAYEQDCMCNDCTFDFYVFGYAVIVFYFLLGAGLIYLWSRTNLKGLLSKKRKLEKEKESLVGIIQDLTNNEAAIPDAANMEAAVVPAPEVALDDAMAKFRSQTEVIYNSKTIKYKDDLQRGRWGGKSIVNSKVLEASYNPTLSTVAGLYNVSLVLRSIDPANPLVGEVAFFLHDTFRNPIRYTSVVNNKAEITITAWEAFVVGARLEDGTELELDLNQIKGFPDGFYWK